ncbi:hypothetical protein A5N15_09550 [Rothia kristinae]|uniref:Uncharacterized protein n=1 Tax=Rothia kristinae TaxID=37923 RepID=A0A657IU56_9MICC|nr:hypothetical protein A5N15_09550 [Rothia kristinae]
MFSRLGEYETFLGAPAQETGALQHDLGAVPEGGALLQTSVRQQRIDTEEVSRASLLLGAAGVEYGATQLEALPVQTETALAWSHLSVHAARAADLLLQAQSTMLELTTDAADYAAKLQAAALSYEHAEQIAGALVGVFDSFYSGAVRQIFTSAFTTVRSLPLVLTPQGPRVRPEGWGRWRWWGSRWWADSVRMRTCGADGPRPPPCCAGAPRGAGGPCTGPGG